MCKKVIPANIPESQHKEFLKNYCAITKCTENLFIFAADHKMEHLAHDFYGPNLDPEIADPEHLFKIASRGKIGAFATHLGLISRYANINNYKNINYIIKLNGKTNLLPIKDYEPLSPQLWNIKDVLELKQNSNLSICGVGYTIYLGSEKENIMLSEAAKILHDAHQNGLVAILWIYPRGKNIKDPHDGILTAGAAGVATSLGADFVKISVPNEIIIENNFKDKNNNSNILNIIQEIAGNTKVICSGGESMEPQKFLEQTYYQIHSGHIHGAAVGRNIYQHKLDYAIKMTQAIYGIIYENLDLNKALEIIDI